MHYAADIEMFIYILTFLLSNYVRFGNSSSFYAVCMATHAYRYEIHSKIAYFFR